MIPLVLHVFKKQGETPLECLLRFKSLHPDVNTIPMTYAGRLDPLAEGVLIILTGDECVRKDDYTALEKEYELTILFGFSTDTYDLLGKITEENSNYELALEDIERMLPRFSGKIRQKYPPYSSRTVEGKPLFQWARDGKINDIEIPSHDVFVSAIEVLNMHEIPSEKLSHHIDHTIKKVTGDFRQDEILSLWHDALLNKEDIVYKLCTLRIVCSSGTYVRAIAHELGIGLGIPTLAFKIVRTRIGENYTLDTVLE